MIKKFIKDCMLLKSKESIDILIGLVVWVKSINIFMLLFFALQKYWHQISL